MYKIVADKHFERSYKKLSENIKKKFKNIIPILENNPFDLKLKTHMLQGEKNHIFSISITHKIRALFIIDKNTLLFTDIGNHDDLY
ncbi:MAG: type II toxin-antitoxin system YafQ family toxin [Candidatus Nomurabacteria bacterium]|nr:type II toxin-antitoxin system YafQ family toxin [Candidatus Nomurabacteria bacterium]